MDLSNRDRRQRLDALAAEYVLGTLPGKARARLARAAAAEPVVAEAIADWDRRLSGLADAVPGVTPSPEVWRRIARRLRFADADADATRGYWSRLPFWRGLAIASVAAFVLLGVGVVMQRTAPPQATLVAVLAGADAKPVLIATATRDERALHVKAVGALSVPADRALELWMLPGTGAPRSMGLITPGATVTLPLSIASGDFLAGAKGLAVSLEPAGGSPTGAPTGPILYTGSIVTI